MLSNRCVEKANGKTVSAEHQLSIMAFLLVFSLPLVGVLYSRVAALSAPSVDYSLSIDVAWGPCYATLLMTILLIGATEAAVRDGSHASQLNVLVRLHMSVRRKREKEAK